MSHLSKTTNDITEDLYIISTWGDGLFALTTPVVLFPCLKLDKRVVESLLEADEPRTVGKWEKMAINLSACTRSVLLE